MPQKAEELRIFYFIGYSSYFYLLFYFLNFFNYFLPSKIYFSTKFLSWGLCFHFLDSAILDIISL